MRSSHDVDKDAGSPFVQVPDASAKEEIMRSLFLYSVWFIMGVTGIGLIAMGTGDGPSPHKEGNSMYATFGAGCFWCVEAVFEQIEGVSEVVSGYTGGHVPSPTYKQICTGTTGHAEVCRVAYDPNVVSFEELLEIFWKTHDPTTLNRQGADVGTQYRSAVFYHSEDQRAMAESYKKKLDKAGIWPNPIVTEITKAPVFYPAEEYHQEYYANNANQPYCRLVIHPKLEKLEALFKDKLKKP